MNDDELEPILRAELRRRLVPGEPSDRVYDHVSRLGWDETSQPIASPGRVVLIRRRAGLLGGLAAAVAIAAVVAAGFYWRSGNTPAAPAWTGPDVSVRSFGRIDAKFGWVVGSQPDQPEALFVTADGGSTWDQRPVPYQVDAGYTSNLVFTDTDHAFVATSTGADGAFTDAVMRTSNGGHTWTKAVIAQNSAFAVVATGLDMLDSQRGWILLIEYASPTRFELLGTTDGGATWSPVVSGSDSAPSQVRFTSEVEGWASSSTTTSGQILHSTDGGKTWAVVSLPVPAGYEIKSREAAPRSADGKLVLHGLAAPTAAPAGFAAVLDSWVTWTSADGGTGWTIDNVESGASAAITDDSGGLTGFAGASESLSLVQPDGQTATFASAGVQVLIPSGSSGRLTSASNVSGTDAWLTIEACQPSSPMSGLFPSCYRLLGTSDGGKNWRPLLWRPATSGPVPTSTSPKVPPCCSMNPVGERGRTREPLTDWLDAMHGWAVIGTNLYWTADGGLTWGGVYPLPASGTIQFVDAQHGWLAASGSSDPGGPIYSDPVYRTDDGGRTWTATDLPSVNEASWTWSHFSDVTHGIVAQCPQLIAGQSEVDCKAFTTDDGGTTFQGPTNETFATPITWLSATVGYGISSGAAVAASTLSLTFDGGRSWMSHRLEALPDGSPCSAFPLAMELTPGGNGRLLVRCWKSSGPNVLAHYETADGGQTWHLTWHYPEATDQFMLAVRVAGADLIGLTETRFWVSKDFGVSWEMLDEPLPSGIHDFTFVDANTGWLVRAPSYASSPDALLGTSATNAHWHAVLQDRSVVTNP